MSTPQDLVTAVSGKVDQWQSVYNSRDVFSGLGADGSVVRFTKSQIGTKNFLVVTPRLRFAISQVAAELEELEQSSGLDQIVIQESDAFVP